MNGYSREYSADVHSLGEAVRAAEDIARMVARLHTDLAAGIAYYANWYNRTGDEDDDYAEKIRPIYEGNNKKILETAKYLEQAVNGLSSAHGEAIRHIEKTQGGIKEGIEAAARGRDGSRR